MLHFSLKSTERLPTVAGMNHSISVDLPHQLGREEARRRIAGNVHKLTDHIPGGAQANSSWAGDELTLNITAMGQSVEAKIDVQDALVRCQILLPPLLAMFAKPIEAMLRNKGADVLLEDHSKR
ncbi:MAG: polyhydroxyalkanoic acid system family protein [Sphingomicrobium sp.]